MTKKPSYEELEQRIRELESKENYYRLIAENTKDMISKHDPNGVYTYVSPACHGLFGYTPDELLGKSAYDFFHPADMGEIRGRHDEILEKPISSTITYRIRHKKGHYVWVETTSKTVRHPHKGSVEEIVASTRDITERKKFEVDLRSSESLFHDLVEKLPLPLIVGTADYKTAYANPKFTELLGYTVEDIPDQKAWRKKFFPDPDYRTEISKEVDEWIHCDDGFLVTFDRRYTDRWGHEHDMIVQVINLKNRFYNILMDVTEQKKYESALRESENRFRELIEITRDIHYRQDFATGSLEYISPSAARVLGYTVEELKGLDQETQKELFHPEDLPDLLTFREDLLEADEKGERCLEREFRMLSKSGVVYWMNGNYFLVRDEEGDPKFIVGVLRDITERRKAEENLRMMVEMLDTAPNSITVHDYEGRFLYANRKTFEIHGYEEKEFMSLNLKAIDIPESMALIEKRMQAVAEKGEASFQVFHFRKDGATVPMEVFVKAVNWAGRPAMLSIATDITERRQSEMERDRLIRAIEQAGEIIVITDKNGSIQYVNPAFENVTGYACDEVLGQNPRILKSGKQDRFFYSSLWDTISSGETWNGRIVNKTKGGALYTEEATISPVKDSTGAISSYVAVKRNITQELELQHQLQQAQKMEAIGTLAGGIAHDFNNILSAIMGFTEIVDADLPEGSRNKEDLGEVIHACKRARDLVKQILTFSRQSAFEARPLRVDLVVNEALKMIRSSTPASIEIQQNIHSDLPAVIADPTQVHQIMMNLCTNAVQAIEDEHGTLTVSLDSVKLDDLRMDEKPDGALTGECVRLRVSDTGKGIPREIQEKIFDPYFTTKKMGEGTGLGLAVVYGIIRESGGTITVESEVNKGTTFSIHFPIAEKIEPEQDAYLQSRIPWGKERVLFVDDEPSIADLAKRILERLGYDVTVRQSAQDALELFRHSPHRFDIVVTDMTMPHMTGDELAGAILSIRPDIPVILCTGYSKRISDKRAREMGIRAFVMKPLTQRELANTVRLALDEK